MISRLLYTFKCFCIFPDSLSIKFLKLTAAGAIAPAAIKIIFLPNKKYFCGGCLSAADFIKNNKNPPHAVKTLFIPFLYCPFVISFNSSMQVSSIRATWKKPL